MSQDFDNNIPDFSKRKTALRILLFLSLISLFILVIQLTYIDELSPLQANLTIINSFVLFILVFLYIILKVGMHATIGRIKEREKVQLPNEFRVDAARQTHLIITYLLPLPIYILVLAASISENVDIFIMLFSLGAILAYSYFLYSTIKSRKYSLEVKDKTITTIYKNKETGRFTIEDIAFVALSASGKTKVKIGDYAIMKIISFKAEKFLEIPLSLKNYWLMKKYFLKHNVNIGDIYNQ
ncbi:MAG: hypothetical protein HG446_004960 [Flavobacteriaceae bacterium]|nr:hypothetical protein [Flavobacteriaceae bacterium]